MKSLYKTPAAIPFLLAVFLNAFVDLGHKIVIQNTIFKIYDGAEQVILTAIVNSLILLPFILLFSPAGLVSDRNPKHKVMLATAWGAVFLTLGITACYAMGWFWAAFAMTFLLAAQSTFYSPAKYGYLRGFFGKERLAEANGVVAAISIVAILAGTLAFSILFEAMLPENHSSPSAIITQLVPLGFILVANSVIELVMMYRLPQTDNPEPKTPLSAGAYIRQGLNKKSLAPALNNQAIKLSIIGLAMFWAIGQVLLAAFPAFAKMQTGETNTIVIQAILAATGLGIALGSFIASRISRSHIELGLVPVGAAGIALGLCLLPSLETQWLMGLDFLFIGTMGGLFIVPLNAMIQFHAKENEIGTVLASNNLIQNIAMLAFLLLTISLTSVGIDIKQLLIFTAIFAIGGGLYTVRKLPQSLVRFILSALLSQRYRIDVQGMKNIPSSGGVLLLGNHISWVDWAIVQLACPRPVQFVMLKSIYERWYLTWFFKLFGCVPIEQGKTAKNSLHVVAELLNEGKVVCLFPEGTLSRTGHLAEFRQGFEHAARAADEGAVILPFYLRGLWGSQFSRSSDKIKQRPISGWRRDIVVAFGKPLAKSTTADVVKRRVFDLSVTSWQSHAQTLPTLAHAWIDTVKENTGSTAIIDASSGTLSASKVLASAIIFSRKIKQLSPEQNIGLLLPSSAAGTITNMAVLMRGKTVVNLNYTASEEALASAVEQANIKTIYTSKLFLRKLESRGIDLSKAFASTQIVYLEEIKKEINKPTQLLFFSLVKLLPAYLLKKLFCRKQDKDNTAAILFSSGTEGNPKGVCLSHTNFMANLKQVSDVLNMRNDDVMTASLPLFHAFGLTATKFLPLIEGIPMVCHPDPTDVLGISKAIAKNKATILFGTTTFLRLYCRNQKIHPLMLESLRAVVAGAEKLNASVRESFKLKFNKDILEGYGATETTPVASVNLPDQLDFSRWKAQLGGRLGSVGMPLPGTSIKIVDPSSLNELATGQDGMILIGGAQVMQGYLNAPEKTQEVIIEIDSTRWYVTGDKGHLDDDGFLWIVDRYSRFAKIGGEMISLGAVENTLYEALCHEYDELELIVTSVEDDKKGEKVVVLCEREITLTEVSTLMRNHGASAIMIPSTIVRVDTLPKLGSGKPDYSLAKKIARESLI